MRKALFWSATIALILVCALAPPAGAQNPLPVDIRAYVLDPAGVAGSFTIPQTTFGWSNILKRYVCPFCGYSSAVRGAAGDDAGYCPDPWAISGHPLQSAHNAASRLTEYTAGRRVVSLAPWEMGAAATADLRWFQWTSLAPPVGAPFYRALLGQPFHPALQQPTGGGVYLPTDAQQRGQAYFVYPRIALNVPPGGLDIDNDSVTDIQPAAQYYLTLIPPPLGSDPWPPDFLGGNHGYLPAGPPVAPVGNVLDFTATPMQLGLPGSPITELQPANLRPGVWRLFLGWVNAAPWTYANADFQGSNGGYLCGAFYLSRVQVPRTNEIAANGPGGATELPNSFLARVLAGQITAGTTRDDMTFPGESTIARRFTCMNRGVSVIESLRLTLLENLVASPGLRVAGRATVKPVLPAAAVSFTVSSTGRGELAARASDPRPTVQVAVPPYQPASEPGVNLGHDPANNWGYRGLALAFNDANGNGGWDFALSDDVFNSTNRNSDTAEEFDVFDLQVSVDRVAALMAGTSAADPGRVSPGVPFGPPDTTVAAGGLPAGRIPFGSGVAVGDDFAVSNESNVAVTPLLLGPNQALVEPVGADYHWRSLGRLLAADAIPLPTVPYTTLAANLAAGLGGEAAGFRTQGLAGQGTAAAPIPLGQSLGNYTGNAVYFMDLNANGQLDFINRVSGAATNTGLQWFDPDSDEPLEPLAAVPTSTRVTEGRLPFNDYYSADTNPTLRFDYAAGGPTMLQVIWVTNRASTGNRNVSSPPAYVLTGAAQPYFPGNLVFANATPAIVGFYRNYLWASPEATSVTAVTAAAHPGSVNTTPETFNATDGSGNHWLLWHRSLRNGANIESTLRFATSNQVGWPGVGTPAQDSYGLYSTGLPKQGLRAFADVLNPGQHWLFWTEGEQGKQGLHYRWAFTGTAADQAADEAPLPLANAVARNMPTDTVADFASGALIRKPSTSPFVYAKDPSPFQWVDPRGGSGVRPQVNVIFSAFAARQGNEDLCWVAFDQDNMGNPARNQGKLTFPRVVNNPVLPATSGALPPTRAGEQLEGDALRQTFASRHLDWLVTAGFPAAPSLGVDPSFYLGLVYSTNPGVPVMYAVNFNAGSYSRARGVYRLTPVVTPVNGPALPGNGTVHTAGVLNNPLGGGGPVVADFEPSTGTLSFGAALFNSANAADAGAVFNTGEAGLGALINVVLYADYTPFILRLTNSDAADDSPTAILESGGPNPFQQRLVLIWRRNYSEQDTPYFGRTSFLYRTWSLGVQVARPAVTGNLAVAAWNGGGWTGLTLNTHYTAYPAAGIVTLGADGYTGGADDGVFWLRSTFDGARVRVVYNDVNGVARSEEHRVTGWSREVPVPVDTVQNEGPVRAVREVYAVPAGGGGTMLTSRYWLVWNSPRPVYDLRAPANAGSLVHQSSDIYLGCLVPEYGALREAEADWQNVY